MYEKEMREAFWQQVKLLLQNKQIQQKPEQIVVGPEFEIFLHQQNKRLATDREKQDILANLGNGFCGELGASVIEVNPPPIVVTKIGFNGWYQNCMSYFEKLEEEAAKNGFSLGMHGTVPWANTTKVERSKGIRYKEIPDYYKSKRPLNTKSPKIRNISLKDPGVVGLLNAYQFSVQALDEKDALQKMNVLCAISPYAVALSANATELHSCSTGWADARFEVWKRTFGNTSRIGLPKRYFETLEEYLTDVSTYPFIVNDPENAFRIGIGAYWKTARIKFYVSEKGLTLAVEFRPLSMQNSVKECIEITTFVLGRLLWSQQNNERLPHMLTNRWNAYQAEKHGLKATFFIKGRFIKARVIIQQEISKAIQGLKTAGIYDAFAEEAIKKYQSKLLI